MGNEAPEATGRAEVMPSVAFDDRERECVCMRVCVCVTETFHNVAALTVDEFQCLRFSGSWFVFSLASVYFLL